MSLLWSQYSEFLDQMSLFWAIVLLPIGLTILIKGADWLVEGAVAVANQLGMSPLIIGLTIVAMGTSAPEVAASVKASLENSPGMAIGNVYGSNIANLALVGGLCAVIRPILISRTAILRDIPLMLGTALLLYGIFYTGQSLDRLESAFMLILFGIVISFMIISERKNALIDERILNKEVDTIKRAAPYQPQSIWVSALIILIGLACLAEGADLSISTAKIIGRNCGLSEFVIGATIIAIGTSLPELVTCLIAAFKGHDDLSIGNLVGSNIFNTLLVIGASGLVKPISFENQPELIGSFYWLMIIVLGLFSAIALIHKKLSKLTGIALLVCYIGYILYSLGVFTR